MASDLQRFVDAQAGIYGSVIAELRRGRKSGHWMWFVFPQIAGLGRSATAQHYALTSLDEARDYVAHPVLGPRLLECSELVLDSPARDAVEIFGSIDAMKLRSSMTLFHRAAPDESVFRAVVDVFCGGVADAATDKLLLG